MENQEYEEQPRMTRSQKEFIFILCVASYMVGALVDSFVFNDTLPPAVLNWHYKSGDVVTLPVGTRPEDIATLVAKNPDKPVARYGNGVAVE